jgi:hypothetical protein
MRPPQSLKSLRAATTMGATALILAALAGAAAAQTPADPLPSWNDGPTKRAILDFVAEVTNQRSPDYVLPAERIACFDNDGTLFDRELLLRRAGHRCQDAGKDPQALPRAGNL